MILSPQSANNPQPIPLLSDPDEKSAFDSTQKMDSTNMSNPETKMATFAPLEETSTKLVPESKSSSTSGLNNQNEDYIALQS